MTKTDRPRTFEEVVAAQDPGGRARLEAGEHFDDATVSNPAQRQVSVHEDRDCSGEWRVEYFDDDGACYVAIFAGPAAEKRARDYFSALKSKQLKTIRDDSFIN